MDLAKLRDQIVACFNVGELESLCFDLHIDYERLSGNTLETKAQELIGYCDRRGHLADLLNRCGELRSHVPWPHVSPIEKLPPLRPLPELFIKNIFAIPREDPKRDERMAELLANERPGELLLLARTGFNYLHDAGASYRLGFGKHLREGKTPIRVLLEDPYTKAAETRLRASRVKERFGKLSPDRFKELSELYAYNLEIRFTENPVYCSLFFTYESVIYDPYHLGRPNLAERVGNHFLVFEFVRPSGEDYLGPRDYYSLLKNHFDFLWSDETKTFKQLCLEHRDELGRFIS